MTSLELVRRAEQASDRTAFRQLSDDGTVSEQTYGDLVDRSRKIAAALLSGKPDLEEARIAYLVPAGIDHTAVQWGIWQAGGVAVPLSKSAAPPELQYTLSDSETTSVIVTEATRPVVEPVCQAMGLPLLVAETLVDGEEVDAETLPNVAGDRRAMILYTSGTTSKPKGVVTFHQTIEAQIVTLVEAWHWQSDDRIPLFLPLHHVHGIINVMSCALWCGATIEPFSQFDSERVLNRVAENAYTIFMAVPTIYVKLIQAIDDCTAQRKQPIVSGFAGMRLMVSGSAALPASVHRHWTSITGQALLERYGMTEIGMALSNPFDGERRPGAVGQALPGVDIRLKSEQGDVVDVEGTPGEIQVRGRCVFREYWKRPEITADSFEDGWFKTGDIAVVEDGYFQIMGRQSVDIIKSGGYKLSALEIEATLLQHDEILECAVVGIPDETWGEAVGAAVVLAEGSDLSLQVLREWCGDKLSKYKQPKTMVSVPQLPRNAMGKVTKPQVSDLF